MTVRFGYRRKGSTEGRPRPRPRPWHSKEGGRWKPRRARRATRLHEWAVRQRRAWCSSVRQLGARGEVRPGGTVAARERARVRCASIRERRPVRIEVGGHVGEESGATLWKPPSLRPTALCSSRQSAVVLTRTEAPPVRHEWTRVCRLHGWGCAGAQVAGARKAVRYPPRLGACSVPVRRISSPLTCTWGPPPAARPLSAPPQRRRRRLPKWLPPPLQRVPAARGGRAAAARDPVCSCTIRPGCQGGAGR